MAKQKFYDDDQYNENSHKKKYKREHKDRKTNPVKEQGKNGAQGDSKGHRVNQ